MKRLFLILMFMMIVVACRASASTPVSGTTRGVSLFYLDGANEDFPWILAHQYDPLVRSRIDALLALYRRDGVNWIRLLVAHDHFLPSEVEPVPGDALIKKVNDFIAITYSGANAGKFHIELVLTTHRDAAGLYTDVAPYKHDKRWLQTWINRLDYTDLGMVMLAGDLSPCYLSGCEGDKTPVDALPINHGQWIKSIWAWKQSSLPGLNASYEVIGVQSASNNNPELISKLASWMNRNTPSNPVIAASLYVSLPTGSTWQTYAQTTSAILDSYSLTSTKALWIDEFGKAYGDHWSAQDQRAAYQGFLAASVCQRPNHYAKFAWATGRDAANIRGDEFGLVESFNGTIPVMTKAWNDLAQYYTLETCSPLMARSTTGARPDR
jgi:hypothetical protein